MLSLLPSIILLTSLFSTTLSHPLDVSLSERSKTALPPTLELFGLSSVTHKQLGCLNASGNFTTNTQSCFPFRSFPVTSGSIYSHLEAGFFVPCTTIKTLNCNDGNPTDPAGLFYDANGYLATGATKTAFSVANLTGGGIGPNGLPVGVPVVIGHSAAVKLVFQVKAVGG